MNDFPGGGDAGAAFRDGKLPLDGEELPSGASEPDSHDVQGGDLPDAAPGVPGVFSGLDDPAVAGDAFPPDSVSRPDDGVNPPDSPAEEFPGFAGGNDVPSDGPDGMPGDETIPSGAAQGMGPDFPGFAGQDGGSRDGSFGEPSGIAPEVSDVPFGSDVPPGLEPSMGSRDAWGSPQDMGADGGAFGGYDGGIGDSGGQPSEEAWSAGGPSALSDQYSDSDLNSAVAGEDMFGYGDGDAGAFGGEGGDIPGMQKSQEQEIDDAEPSEKKPVSHKNAAMFLNRNMLIMAVGGGLVVIFLFFTVILPLFRPSGGKAKKQEFSSGGGMVPKEISDIPDGIAAPPPEPVPEPEPEPEPEVEEDLSEKFPDPSAPTPVEYTYDYTVTSGNTYDEVEEYDSSADVQQVGFSDVEITEDPTASTLKSKIQAESTAEASRLVQEYQRRKLAGTWMPYRPAEGYEDVSALASSAAMGGAGSDSASDSASGGLGGLGADGSLDALYAQMLAKGGGAAYSYDQQNGQANKGQFRQAQTSAGNYKYNGSTTLWKGTIIPAVLETAINTDLPGMVVATVTQNIYSSYDGKYLLIPQGSKVFAEYNSSVSYNQGRVQIAWNTLIRPDGLEINLGRVDGVDAQGHAGVPGAVNRHPFEYAKAMALIAIFSVVNTKMVNTVNGYGKGKGANGEDLTNDYYENLYADMQSEANKISGDIMSRALDIQPTITIESGTKVNLITNATMVLPPLQADKPKRKYVRKE